MPLPTEVIVAGLVGAGCKNLVDDIYKTGRTWFLKRFGKHQEKAAAEAEKRMGELLDKVAHKVDYLEQDVETNAAMVRSVLEDPGFTMLMHSALRGAVETGDSGKHDLLATMIAKRLTAPAESLECSVITMAVEVIPRMRPSHFAALAFTSAMRFGAPTFDPAPSAKPDFLEICDSRVSELLNPFAETTIEPYEVLELDLYRCARAPEMSSSDREGLQDWAAGEFFLSVSDFMGLPTIAARTNWAMILSILRPTPLGDLIGLAALQAAGAKSVGVACWKSWFGGNDDVRTRARAGRSTPKR